MTDDSLLGQLAEEFTQRVREGKLPDIEEYASRYPELADRIRELFPTLMLLEGMAATGDSGGAEAPPSLLSPGSVFGNYRIEREIGRGGMGIVYERVLECSAPIPGWWRWCLDEHTARPTGHRVVGVTGSRSRHRLRHHGPGAARQR